MRGSRLKGTNLTSTGVSDARNDPAQALPQRLLDPVGVWNGLDWDNGLGHGHPTDLGVVITQAGENRGHYLPGLVPEPRICTVMREEWHSLQRKWPRSGPEYVGSRLV